MPACSLDLPSVLPLLGHRCHFVAGPAARRCSRTLFSGVTRVAATAVARRVVAVIDGGDRRQVRVAGVVWGAIEGYDRSLVSILMSYDLRSNPRSTDTVLLPVLETSSTATRSRIGSCTETVELAQRCTDLELDLETQASQAGCGQNRRCVVSPVRRGS